ncbi:pyridoxamine 5'-phosphate oxidase [Aquimarina sp. MMG016]|uniref:pyridoxamine 5'-phosphate oxidase n=1 Tax=Aquimarina sp. MMG016 TaxID=2822690 RepID=UPI001B39F768|nr:pyridoxamine 5'-phosphate oxidase [Aquimarina sp. MMG016]MBQ4820954.1 pyridoxamine 5'-phosphate oxidase [Aquimarina sp. MMG016]
MSPADHNPIEYFQKWFHEIHQKYPEIEANAMLLSTIGLDGYPKSRIVLLKQFTWEGFIFFTNYESEKGKAIASNNNVSILFNWSVSHRKVLISGSAEKIPENLSEGYFESRPEGSKLGAWASKQSDIVTSRKNLEDQLKHYQSKFKDRDIPKPEYWGGYIIKPEVIEFTKYDALLGVNKIIIYKMQSDYNWSKDIKYSIV